MADVGKNMSPEGSGPSAAPVFVIGAPRSGTSALGRALGLHRGFHADVESLFLLDLFGEERLEAIHARWVGRPINSWMLRHRVSVDDFLQAVGLGIRGLLSTGCHGRRWVDHTPAYALIAGTLARAFPDAQFLHILRDGREVVNSMINVPRGLRGSLAERLAQAEFLPEWTRDFRAACETWRDYVRAAAAFADRHPDRCLTVMQRDLESDPAATYARIYGFLGASPEDGPAEFLQRYRVNSSFTAPGGCREEEYRRPDPWTSWTDEQRATFVEVAGAEMLALGLAATEDLMVPPPPPSRLAAAEEPRAAPGRTPVDRLFPGMRYAWHEPQERQWHPDIGDGEFWELVAGVWDYTLSNVPALHHLYRSCRHLLDAAVPGDLVECGAFLGGGVMLLAEVCRRHGGADRTIYALDTFRGALRRGDEDVDQEGRPCGGPFEVPLDFAREAAANMRSGDWPESRVRIVAGDVVETSPRLACDRIALLRLDTDTFHTTLATLESLYPRVSPGGIVIVGNHGWCRGQRLACERYFAGRPVHLVRIDRYCASFVRTSS